MYHSEEAIMKLNLEAKTKEQELVKLYLENNASQTLAEKINNGTPFEKDGKILTNKKTLDSFMKYASDEARKLASKGASCACVEDKVVYGWAIHYFEEDSIEGTLYNEDGTEYKPAPKYTPAKVKKAELEKPKQQQVSLFDFMDSEQKEDTPNREDTNIDTESEDDEYEELTEEEMREFDGDIDEPKSLLDKIEDDLDNNTSDNYILSTLKRIFENNIIVR